MTHVKVLGFTERTDIVIKENVKAIKKIIARYKKRNLKTVDYLEVLEINDHNLKDFLVVVSTQIAGETRILSVQYRKKPILLNIVNQFRKLKSFLKEVTMAQKELGVNTEIKEWMR